MSQFELFEEETEAFAISPFQEMGAYEALRLGGSSLDNLCKGITDAAMLLSALVGAAVAVETARQVIESLRSDGIEHFGVRVKGDAEYPKKLLDARCPVPVLYYQGIWDLAWTPTVAVVGTRKPSAAGLRRAQKLVQFLVEDGWTIASGLATGIDTAAHTAALESGGHTIGVLGTPLSASYPKQNRGLQARIAAQHLLISQVPVLYYKSHDYRHNRRFFPERNLTMSALSEATIIVEAGETSGTLIQAKAALEQGRKLFILDSCFRSGLRWPARFEERGAVRVQDFADIRETLGTAVPH